MKATIFLILTLILAGAVHAAPVQLSPKSGQISFLAIGKPSFLKIRGEGKSVTGKANVENNKLSAEFEADMSVLDTGIAVRNEHMKEKYLEVGKYPKAKLTIAGLDLKKNWSVQSPELEQPFTGQLTLHGVTKPVSGDFTVNADKTVKAKFKLNIKDYEIALPSFQGITMAENVDVEVALDGLNIQP